FARVTGQGVAAEQLKESDKLLVIHRGLAQELAPERTIRGLRRWDICYLSDAVVAMRRAQPASAQVDRPSWRAKQETVAIPDLLRHCEGSVGASEPLDSRSEAGLRRNVADACL